MKIVHNKYKETGADIDEAKRLETEGEWEKAAAIYNKLVDAHPHNEKYHDRLMIIYRKSGDPKKELSTIRRGINIFEDFHRSFQRPAASKKVMQLSKALLHATGLSDKKGRPLYDREPVARWKKRKELVEKRLNRAKNGGRKTR